jgi:hypothetical protein
MVITVSVRDHIPVKAQYSRAEIKKLLWSIRGRPYNDRTFKALVASIRSEVGQVLFPIESVAKILGRAIALQLYPAPQHEPQRRRLLESDFKLVLEEYRGYVSQVLLKINELQSFQLPDTIHRDLNFLADAMVAIGLRRLSSEGLKARIQEYFKTLMFYQKEYNSEKPSIPIIDGILIRIQDHLIEISNGEIRRSDSNFLPEALLYGVVEQVRDHIQFINEFDKYRYDYNRISGRIINGVLLQEYNKVNKTTWNLEKASQSLVARARILEDALAIMQHVANLQANLAYIKPLHCAETEDEKLTRAIALIVDRLARLGDDYDNAYHICLKFIKRWGRSGRRKLSLASHPDYCKAPNAHQFQVILNTCGKYDSGVSDNGETIEDAIALYKARLDARPKRCKRKFHYSPKWEEYKERRKSEGWHTKLRGSASAVGDGKRKM